MIRKIFFKKYRNLGIEKDESFILNYSTEEKKIGNLILLIGSNGSGKSNILDGIQSLNRGYLFNRDKTELRFDEKYKKPNIVLSLVDNDKSNQNSSITLSLLELDKNSNFLKDFKKH